MLLAGDIGGTKTTLATFSPDNPQTPICEEKYPSAEFKSLEKIVEKFRTQHPHSHSAACFGIAGPVVQGRVQTTNLPWIIAEQSLAEKFTLKKVKLLNDLEAVANSIEVLQRSDLHTLNTGTPIPKGSIAVVAPGTGLGEAFLTWDGRGYIAHASEGGHCDYAPQNELEVRLLEYLMKKFGHVSYERICSGIGIPNIYAFLRDGKYFEEPSWLRDRLAKEKDPNPVIMAAAFSTGTDSSELCAKTLELFISALGAKAGNLALTILATGGVYIGGGIPPKILPALKSPTFFGSFIHKGRYEDLMEKVPLHIILNPQAALLGAANFGLKRLVA